MLLKRVNFDFPLTVFVFVAVFTESAHAACFDPSNIQLVIRDTSPQHQAVLMSSSGAVINGKTVEYEADSNVAGIQIALLNLPSSSAYACQQRITPSKSSKKWQPMLNCQLDSDVETGKSKEVHVKIVVSGKEKSVNRAECKKSGVKTSSSLIIFSTTVHLSKPKSRTEITLPLQQQQSSSSQQVTCSLGQDCDVKVQQTNGGRPCGLRSFASSSSWADFQSKDLPVCDRPADLISTDGQWILPCDGACGKTSNWQLATWQPSASRPCRLASIAQNVDNCLDNLTILHVGDSTLRIAIDASMAHLPAPVERQVDLDGNFCRTCTLAHGGKRSVLFRAFYYNRYNTPCYVKKVYEQRPRHCTFQGAFDTAIEWLVKQRTQRPDRKYLIVVGETDNLNEVDLRAFKSTLEENELLASVPVVVRAHVATVLAADAANAELSSKTFNAEEVGMRQADNYRLLALAQQLGFTPVDAWAMTVLRWKELDGKQITPPTNVLADKSVRNQWLSENSDLRAEAQTLTTAMCMALQKAH